MFTAEFLVPDSNQQLMASLVKCLKAVADSYNPAILDTTIPSNLFGALVKLLAVRHPGKYLHVAVSPRSTHFSVLHADKPDGSWEQD